MFVFVLPCKVAFDNAQVTFQFIMLAYFHKKILPGQLDLELRTSEVKLTPHPDRTTVMQPRPRYKRKFAAPQPAAKPTEQKKDDEKKEKAEVILEEPKTAHAAINLAYDALRNSKLYVCRLFSALFHFRVVVLSSGLMLA